MTKGYLRCVDCKSDYNPFKDTWLSTVKIDHVKWLVLIKLFDLGISARQSAREASISYPTALHVFDCIRFHTAPSCRYRQTAKRRNRG